jgi:hypothetical protein
MTEHTKEQQQPSGARTCKGRNKQGDRCRSTFVGAGGYCTAHDPERKVDMRLIGSRGGRSRRKGAAERLPAGERESLRQHLRANLDPADVLEAVQRSLGGANESARVAAVRLLADLELYRQDDGGCPDCAARAVEAEGASERLDERLQGVVVAVFRALLVTGEPAITDPRIVRLTLERIRADERLGPAAAFLASTRTIEAELESRTAELALERDQALARLSEFGA